MSSKKQRDYHSGYLRSVFNNTCFRSKLRKAIKLLRNAMRDPNQKIDAIAFTGVSGAAFAFPLSYSLSLPLICVRKKDDAHAIDEGNLVEGCTDAKTYIIVDDFVSSGRTIKEIKKGVESLYWNKPAPKHVGTLLYHSPASEVEFVDRFNKLSYRSDEEREIVMYLDDDAPYTDDMYDNINDFINQTVENEVRFSDEAYDEGLDHVEDLGGDTDILITDTK